MTAEGYDAGPVAALRRLAFLLERAREDTYKVKAFRGAAATILPLGDDAVARAVADGTLTDLPGIGPARPRSSPRPCAASSPTGWPAPRRSSARH